MRIETAKRDGMVKSGADDAPQWLETQGWSRLFIDLVRDDSMNLGQHIECLCADLTVLIELTGLQDN